MTAAAAPYSSSIEHLLAEVARVDLLLAVHALTHAIPTAQRRATSTDERIAALLDQARAQAPAPSPALIATHRESERLASEIETRVAMTSPSKLPLRLKQLEVRFGLHRREVDLLLAALVPEMPGTASRRTTVGAMLAALFPSIEAQIGARRHLGESAALLRNALVYFEDDSTTAQLALPARTLVIDTHIAAFLLGDDSANPRIAPYVQITRPEAGLDSLLLPSDLQQSLPSLMVHLKNTGMAAPIITIAGPAGAGKRSLAAALCAHADMRLLIADCAALLAAGEETFVRLLPIIAREAILAGAALHWSFADTLLSGGPPAVFHAFLSALKAHPGLVFVSSKPPLSLRFGDRHIANIEMPRLSAADQGRLWERALGERPTANIDLPALTSTFRLTGGQIFEAAGIAKKLGRRHGSATLLGTSDLQAACRSLHEKRIGSLARAIVSRQSWDDLVLPADKKALLLELCLHLRHRSRVLNDWGYERKLSLGKGLAALLSGPPGTGKTMAAGVIANELGVTLLHIDLSTVVSKYIGETEKHLAELFDAAEDANAALFFDEADALFGKRTEVKDAHDRYANLETSYLLQRIESYGGVVLCATNFMKNIDDAFVRRFAFVIELPFPTVADRLRIWQGIWTPETPLDRDMDMRFLAERIELSGGYIRNIALAAVFLAAHEGKPVALRHVLHAARREFQKMGKVVDAGFFDVPR